MSDYSLGVSYSTELPTGICALSASIFDSCPRFNLGNWAFRQLSVSIRAIGQLGIPIVRVNSGNWAFRLSGIGLLVLGIGHSPIPQFLKSLNETNLDTYTLSTHLNSFRCVGKVCPGILVAVDTSVSNAVCLKSGDMGYFQ